MPSRKWWAARITALTGLATLIATSGGWTQQATIMAITLVSAAGFAWALPNEGESGEKGQTEPLTLLVYVIVVIILVVVLFKVLEQL